MTLDASTLVGLLAEEDRRRVVAALVLGASSFDEVVARAGMDAAATGRALARLADAGLVERGRDGSLVLLGEAFPLAARAARAASAANAPRTTDEHHPDPDAAKVLRAFLTGGRLRQIPVARTKRRVVLERLAQEFEPGRRYGEREVNSVLARWHPDTASLRRYLVDEGFLDREAGQYWRCGGPVDVDPEAGRRPWPTRS